MPNGLFDQDGKQEINLEWPKTLDKIGNTEIGRKMSQAVQCLPLGTGVTIACFH